MAIVMAKTMELEMEMELVMGILFAYFCETFHISITLARPLTVTNPPGTYLFHATPVMSISESFYE